MSKISLLVSSIVPMLVQIRSENKRNQEVKRMIKLEFLNYTLKKSPYSPFGAWSFLLFHIQFTPSQGPLQIYFLRNQTVEVCGIP